MQLIRWHEKDIHPIQAKDHRDIGYPNLSRHKTIYTTLLDRNPLPVISSSVPGLSVVPSHILLSNTDVELTTAKDHREARLKNQLDRIKNEFDFIFIDCPPALGWLTINAFSASDMVLVVVEPGYFELDSIVQLNKTLEEVKDYYHPDLQLLAYMFTKADPTINSRTSLQILRQTYTKDVAKTIIPKNGKVKRKAQFSAAG